MVHATLKSVNVHTIGICRIIVSAILQIVEISVERLLFSECGVIRRIGNPLYIARGCGDIGAITMGWNTSD